MTLVAGVFLTPITRNAGLIGCYLVAGLGASIASATAHPYIVSVGASGAIFGLFGILLTLSVLKDERLESIRKLVLINAAIFITINLLIGAATPGIDNAAHIGGLTTGIVLGLVIYFVGRSKSRHRQAVSSRASQQEND